MTAPRVNDKRIDADTRAAATVFVGTYRESTESWADLLRTAGAAG